MTYDPAKCAERAGKLTASMAAVVMGDLKTDGLKRYVRRLAWERAFGVLDEPEYKSGPMQRGNDLESQALDWYEFQTGVALRRDIGFVQHPEIAFVGASPDALAADRTVQIKCPLHGAWIDVFESRRVPSEYRWQMRWEMWVCGLRCGDFVAWHPQAGGLIVPIELADDEEAQMRERAHVVDAMVCALADTLRAAA